MEADAAEVLRKIAPLHAATGTALDYELIDLKAWSALSSYLSEKIRGATALHEFKSGGSSDLRESQAVAHLQKQARALEGVGENHGAYLCAHASRSAWPRLALGNVSGSSKRRT